MYYVYFNDHLNSLSLACVLKKKPWDKYKKYRLLLFAFRFSLPVLGVYIFIQCLSAYYVSLTLSKTGTTGTTTTIKLYTESTAQFHLQTQKNC